MSRQVCLSQDDTAHGGRDTTYNWELNKEWYATSAQPRDSARNSALVRWPVDSNKKFHKRTPETLEFP